MKQLFLIATLLLTFKVVNSQIKIHKGDGTRYSNKVIFTIDGNKIRQGDGTSDISNKVICTVEGEYFFTIGGTFYSVDGSLTRTKMACILLPTCITPAAPRSERTIR